MGRRDIQQHLRIMLESLCVYCVTGTISNIIVQKRGFIFKLFAFSWIIKHFWYSQSSRKHPGLWNTMVLSPASVDNHIMYGIFTMYSI